MTSKNCFVEGNRKTSVMISKDRVNSSGITGKYIDFSKIKLFRQRDTLDISKNNGKEKIGKVFLYES